MKCIVIFDNNEELKQVNYFDVKFRDRIIETRYLPSFIVYIIEVEKQNITNFVNTFKATFKDVLKYVLALGIILNKIRVIYIHNPRTCSMLPFPLNENDDIIELLNKGILEGIKVE